MVGIDVLSYAVGAGGSGCGGAGGFGSSGCGGLGCSAMVQLLWSVAVGGTRARGLVTAAARVSLLTPRELPHHRRLRRGIFGPPNP